MHRQNGFGAVQLFLVLVVISIIGFTGWFVWQSQKETDATLRQSRETGSNVVYNLPKLYIDKTLVPTGWTLNTQTLKDVELDNANGEEVVANRCFVHASVRTVPSTESTDNLDADVLAQKEHTIVKDAKGYSYSLINREIFNMLVDEKIQAVNGYYGKYYRSDDTSYQLSGYVLSENSYVEIIANCSTQDLTQAKSVLAAISVKM